MTICIENVPICVKGEDLTTIRISLGFDYNQIVQDVIISKHDRIIDSSIRGNIRWTFFHLLHSKL